MIIKQIFYNLINNTKLINELPVTEEAALKYLNYITHPNFGYRNDNNYDAYDYQKIIYIEMNFQNNEEIQQKIKDLKKYIAQNYIYRKKYLKRIKNDVFNSEDIVDVKALKFFTYPLPDLEKEE